MQTISVGEFKSNFSTILKQVQLTGQKVVVEYGKNHKRVAMLVPYDENLEKNDKRKFGILQGKGSFNIKDDFAMSDEELIS